MWLGVHIFKVQDTPLHVNTSHCDRRLTIMNLLTLSVQAAPPSTLPLGGY